MFTALTLCLVLGASIPAPTAPTPTRVAPRVMELKPDASGKIMVTITRMEPVQIDPRAAILAWGVLPATLTRMVPVTKIVELGDVKDLVFTTADGMKVEKDTAMKRVASGAVVVVTSDGYPVSPTFLKVFKDNTLVLASPEFDTSMRRGLPLPRLTPDGRGLEIEVLSPVPVEKVIPEK